MMWPVIDRLEEVLIFRRYRAQQEALSPINIESPLLPRNDSATNVGLRDAKRCDCGLEWKRNLLRASLVLLALGLGIGIPAYDLFTQLIGSLFSTTLSFSVPILIHLRLFSWKRRKTCSGALIVAKDISILILGAVATVRFLMSNSGTQCTDILPIVSSFCTQIVCTGVTVRDVVIAIQTGRVTWSIFH
jgi:hypothetical protein